MTELNTQMSGESLNIAEQRKQELKQLFPSVFTEIKNDKGEIIEAIDYERLKAELGNFSEIYDNRRERYGMDWPGKRDCLRLIQEPSRATLKPCRDESVEFDKTENLFIEGDNLEVLKLLQKAYYGKIKMIYIDPPYNTGGDFVYPDSFQNGIDNYLEITGQINAGRKMSSNTETNGRFHSDWMNMMLPRLKLAQNLLAKNGAIFISCDEGEHIRLRMLMDEMFGEENFVADMIWAAGRKNDSRLISVSHEYIVCYARDKNYLKDAKVEWRQRKKGIEDIYNQYEKLKREHGSNYLEMTVALKRWYKDLADGNPAKAHKHYCQIDERGIYFAADISWPGGGGPKYEVIHPITKKPVKIPARGWITPDQEKMKTWISENKVHFGETEEFVPCLKSYLKDQEYQAPYSVFYQDGRAATKRLRALMGEDCFNFPKDETVLQDLIGMMTSGEDIIIDFFAGSGTTGQSVLAQNTIDSSNRKYILVQLPEPLSIENKDQASAARYCDSLGRSRFISELTKERLLRASQKIREEISGQLDFEGKANLDLGFKVLKLDRSNFKHWQAPAKDINDDELAKQFELHIDHIDPNASQEDILYELLIKAGVMPTKKIELIELANHAVFSVDDGGWLICLQDTIEQSLIDAVLAKEPVQFICLDRAFHGNDQLKANAISTFADFNQGRDKADQIEFRTV